MHYDDKKDYDTKLMEAISDCIIRKRINKVINYNFDSVLEQCLYKKYFFANYSSNNTEILNGKTLIRNTYIYHVHGYIPYDYDSLTDVYSFIFNDSEYYENMMNPLSYCNTTQENTFLNENVVFVGCSFADANIKDLLRKTKDKRIDNKIYAFLKVPSFKAAGNDMSVLKDDYIAIQNEYFKSLGVEIIWVDDYDEIPIIINSL